MDLHSVKQGVVVKMKLPYSRPLLVWAEGSQSEGGKSSKQLHRVHPRAVIPFGDNYGGVNPDIL